MKKYVILGYIYGIGGWQTYINNKLKLMEENGWKIYAISNGMRAMPGKMLPILERFKDNRLYALSFHDPNELSHRGLKRTYDKVGKMIEYREGDEIIFETTILDYLMWAEFLAKRFHGRSVCVDVSNSFKNYCHTTLDFFHFKEQRGELMMMSKTGLHRLFSDYIDYPEVDNNTVGAMTQNEFADDGRNYRALLKTSEADYVIGTVGWLDKGYYAILIDEVIKFANENADKKIQFIVVGKSLKGNIERDYEKKAKDVPNLILNLMGSIAPVPSNLVKLFDVAVASYGCAIITDNIGVKTILMHDPELIPLGILSYTVIKPPINTRVNFDKSISEMITDVLINNICDQYEYSRYYQSRDVEEQKKRHLERIKQFSEQIEYYDVENMPIKYMGRKHKVKVIFQKVFGLSITEIVFPQLTP